VPAASRSTTSSTPTSYTSPAGNGSSYSLSSNVWKAGDYYEAVFSTTGFTNLNFSFDLTRSSTGPASWEVVMSLDGGATFASLIPSLDLTAVSWSSSTYNPASTYSVGLGRSAIDAGSVMVRVRALVDAVSSSGAFAAGGTARIDNVMVYGDVIPAPGAVALLGIAGLAARRRRR